MKIKFFDIAIEYLFFALMLLTPIIFDRRIGIVFSGTKSAEIRLLLLLIVTIWFIKLLCGGKHNFKRTPLDWPIVAYLLSISAATITAVNVMISFFGFYGRYEGLITWYCYALMFFIATNYLRGFDKIKQFAALIATASNAMAIYGIIQRMGTDPYAWGGVVTNLRVIATIGQPNFLSAYMIMSFFFLMYYMFGSNEEKKETNPLIGIINKFTPKNPKKTAKKTNYSPKLDYNCLLQITSIISCFIAVPLLFIVMIYSQSGENIIIWYSFFVLMAAAGVYFAVKSTMLPDNIMKILIGASLILSYTCNFFTQSRGGYIGLIVGAVVLFLLLPRKSVLKAIIPLSILGAFILSITIATSLNPEYSPFGRFTDEVKVGEDGGSIVLPNNEVEKGATVKFSGAAGSRGETWKSALGIIADNPVFGIGSEDLKMVFPRYETNLFRFKEAFHVKQDRCHNETFDVPVTKGLVSFFIYLFILYSIYYHGIKSTKNSSDDKKIMIACTLSAMTAYLFQNQFSFGVIAITSLFWVLWAIVMNINSEKNTYEEKEVKLDDIPWLIIGIIFVVMMFLSWVFMLQFQSDKEFKTGKTLMDMRRLNEAVPYFKRALSLFPFEGGNITHLGITLLNVSGAAQGENQAQIQNEALQIFNFGMKVDPYNADNFYISSRILLMQNNAAKALEYINNTLKIDPYYAEAYLALALVAERQGKMADAEKYYSEAYRINPFLLESAVRVAQKYISQGKIDKAFKILQDLVLQNPQDPNVHKLLGIIYAKKGQMDRANEEFNFIK